MTLALFLTYCAATFAFSLAPGPAVLLVSGQAMARGAMAGILASAGCQLANAIVWSVFSVGIGAVIAASVQFFLIVKFIGAAYLIVLGVLTIRNARRSAESAMHAPATPLWKSPFLQAFANQAANPKAYLFMAVLVPQFMTPGRTTIADIVVLAVACLIIDFLVLSGYGLIAARTGALFSDPAKVLWRERAAGVAQIAVGGMIAAMRRAA
jgi:threonine/homoserine/homoserine lactone efflux protein